MTYQFKRIAALILALLMMITPALAQTACIEGEIEADAAALSALLGLDESLLSALGGELSAAYNENGLHVRCESGMTLTVNLPADGTVLFSTDAMQQSGKAFMLPGLPKENPIDRVHAWFDQQGDETAYVNAVYSSLFTRALSIDLTGQMLSPVLGEVLAQYPFLPALLSLDAAAVTRLASSAQTDAVWGNITRFKGDAQQYPDLDLLLLTLHLPNLPYLYLWLRTDEFGSTFKFAMEESEVTDWAETLLVLEEGASDTGFLLSGFTLNFEDDEELNIYIEATLTTPDYTLTAECDYYLDYTGDYLWAVEMLVGNEELGDLMEMKIEATKADEEAEIPDMSALTAEML